MPVDKQVLLRYQVLNKCFRNRYREFTIDDLVEECNKAMSKELDKYDGVSKRTIQDDIAKLQMPPYNIRLNENLRKGYEGIVNLYFILCHKPSYFLQQRYYFSIKWKS